MRRLMLLLVLAVTTLFRSTFALATGSPSGDTPDSAGDPENLLYGSWYYVD